MKVNNFNEKGITLIALVITIILLIILAGVTIGIVINAGILEKSQTAADSYKYQQAKEQLDLAIVEYKFLKITGENTTFEEIISKIGEIVEQDEETGKYIVKIDGFEFEVSVPTIGGGTTKEPEAEKYTITISGDEGINSVSNGATILKGANHSISAEVKSGYRFNKWEIISGSGTFENENNASTTITPTSNITIQATTLKEYTLTITSKSEAMGSVSGDSGTKTVGESCTVTATPNTGYRLDGWYEGDTIVSEKKTYTFDMPDRDYNLEARFFADSGDI